MAGPLIKDRVRETSISTGIGVFSLAGAVGGFQDFVTGIGDGNTCFYCITDGTLWEVGRGLVTAGIPNTLTRLVVFDGSNGPTQENFGVGTKEIFVTPLNELLAPRYAKLLLTAAVAAIATATPAEPVWDVDFEDTYVLHTVSVQETFEADVPGLYEVSAGGRWQANATGVRSLRLKRDGDTNPFAEDTRDAAATGVTAQNITATIRLAATNRVRVEVEQTSGGALDWGQGSDGARQDAAWFTIRRVGA